MAIVRTVALYILILFTTGYVGLGVFHLFCPFDQHFDTQTYATYWKIVDGYMGKRMSIYMPLWFVVIMLNLGIFAKTWRKSPIFWMILLSMVLLAADISFTLKAQLPINQFFRTHDVAHLTPDELPVLEAMRIQTTKNFGTRGLGAAIMFFMLSTAPYMLPSLNQRMGATKAKPTL
jgi:hypothetical protein